MENISRLNAIPQNIGEDHREVESLTDRAIRTIRKLIVVGELSPGIRISERSICEQYGYSRTPVREAFKILALEGLINISQNKGATVAQMSRKEVSDVLQILKALEGVAAEAACERITEGALNELDEMHNALVRAYDDQEIVTYFEINQSIHQAIMSASGNEALSKTYQTLSGRIQRYRYVGNLDGSRWAKAVKEHEHIMTALRDRDAPLLKQILASHLDNGWRVAKRMTEGKYEDGDPMPVILPRKASV